MTAAAANKVGNMLHRPQSRGSLLIELLPSPNARQLTRKLHRDGTNRWISFFMIMIGVGLIMIGSSGVEAGNNTVTDEVFFEVTIQPSSTPLSKSGTVETWRGRFVVGLFGDAVPMTAWNFISLTRGYTHVNSKQKWHYKNTQVHRVVPDFLIQMGDVVYKDGRGGRGVYAPFFIDENYVHSHRAGGFVAMANQGPDTNGSQFYISLNRARWLDGKNVVFGKVISGMSTVLRIAELATNERGNPKQKVTIVDCGLVRMKKPYDLSEDQLSSPDDIQKVEL